MKVLIVGGVAGGASAAARLRRLDEQAAILLFERGPYISYANCGLPYFIGEEIKEREKIIIQTPESFRERFNVDVRVGHEVTVIDRQRREVTVRDIEGGSEYRESYDRLILSPGAEPLLPKIPGVESRRIFTLRSVPDADRIKSFIAQRKPRRAVVVGAGYIGLEMAENLRNLGIFVTIVEMGQQVIAPLDFEMAAEVHQHLKTRNVEFYLGEQVVAFKEDGTAVRLSLKSGKEIAADFVIMSAGIRPETGLAKQAGLRIGESGGIFVNEYLQTSDENIYAVGDAAEVFDPVFETRRLVPLAGPANKQGRIAANNIALGNRERYCGSAGTAIAKVFDLTVGVTGYAEKQLRQRKADYASVIIHSVSHAGYYPGALPMSIKINFSRKDGKLYGAQVVGYDGVDKATEAFSLICQFGLGVGELRDMDHAYAPPYSSAKSPVNMAGFVADNVLSGKMNVVSWEDVERRDRERTFLLDVRTAEEVALGSIEGSRAVPLNELRAGIAEIPRGRPIYVYCAVGLRAYMAARILMQNGFDEVYNLSGGYKTWENATMKQSNEDIFEKYCVAKDDMLYLHREGKKCDTIPFPEQETPFAEIDARGLQCPGPIMKLNERMSAIDEGARVKVIATDPGFLRDVQSWCSVTGNELLGTEQEGTSYIARIRKQAETGVRKETGTVGGNDKTIILFDDDMDRALAAFVITNGALAMGRKVTIFFTFWGLNILQKRRKPPVNKDLVSRMFAFMLPKGAWDLRLSKLNMFGIGPWMMNRIMKRKNIDTLDTLMDKALRGGARLLACQMSMDVMGIKREELIDGIEVGGVATYIEATEKANLNLFI